MKQTISFNAFNKIWRRYLCSENTKKYDPIQMSNTLKKYLSESPLKGYEEQNEWATMPYPEGAILKQKQDGSEKIDPETTSVIMFPGQGNQYIGMGKSLFNHSVVEDMFDAASSILGYNLKKLCLSGPLKQLNRTEYCQPATLVCSLAAVEELKSRYPSAVTNCIATCGFSLGEIAALVFAGSISFEDAVKITKVRAKAMQECSNKTPSGMMTVLYGADSRLKEAIAEAKNHCSSQGISDPVCEIANYLFAECKVIAGHEEALNYMENNMKTYKLRKCVRLPVSGAFHTDLMKDAAIPFEEALKKLTIKDPLVPVLSNVTNTPFADARDIRKKLIKQIYKPVKWEQILHYLYNRKPGTKFPQTYECGPGNSLLPVLKRVNSRAHQNSHKIDA